MLKVERLSAGYSDLPVIIDVSITVDEGQFVSIVGPNGAGKTTLFKTISGSCAPKSRPHLVEGPDLAAVPAARRPHLGIAHVPEGRQVFPADRDGEPGDGCLHRGRPRRWKRNLERSFALLPVLPTAAHAARRHAVGRRAADGGGRARARLLAQAADAGRAVDGAGADHRRFHLRVLEEIRREDGLTILLVEQRVVEALESCDHGYVLETGRVVLEGTRDSLLANDRVRQAYLGM